ncbi:hypothetical protein EDD18DRAFT_1415309 [Armillaria luteobubalina]|uniref:DUF6534 domain-containing protein n=1 Tax=Armillaria luteobubalina TaxID=153913 RepID=A0AA39UPK9_9AGAR|nr:hypothetical protein EDD18DRAFT_1415309 [Armillaria luteobubalina]
MSSLGIPSLGMTLGAIYLGAMVAAILFGITNLQTVIYYKKYPGDWWVYRYSVASLWILDALHVALSTHALYQYLITLYGSFFATYEIIWSFKLHVLITLPAQVLIVIEVQALYTVRLWKVNSNFYEVVPWLVVLSVTAAFSTGIYSVVEFFSLSSFLSIAKIRYLVWPNSFIFIGINFILPKLYINSSLAMLNARESQKPKSGESHVDRVPRFPPRNRSGDPGVDIVLTETSTLDRPKDGCNFEV